jgi:hypothetical protein
VKKHVIKAESLAQGQEICRSGSEMMFKAFSLVDHISMDTSWWLLSFAVDLNSDK